MQVPGRPPGSDTFSNESCYCVSTEASVEIPKVLENSLNIPIEEVADECLREFRLGYRVVHLPGEVLEAEFKSVRDVLVPLKSSPQEIADIFYASSKSFSLLPIGMHSLESDMRSGP